MSDEVVLYLPRTLAGRGMLRRSPTPQSQHASAIISDESQIGDYTAAMGGRTAKPRKNVVIWAPDGRHTIILQGGGVTEAAWFEDQMHEQLGRAREAMARNGGRVFDAEEERERLGLPRREDVGVAMAEAIWAKAKEHRSSPRTNPAPQLKHRPSSVGRTVHAVADPRSWTAPARQEKKETTT